VGTNLKEDDSVTSAAADDHEFIEFWSLYPKRNGKKLGKAKTYAKWTRLKLPQRAAAIAGVRHYRAACEGGATLAKDPERWVRDHCWEDWQEPAELPARRGVTAELERARSEAIAAQFLHRDQEGEQA
jgi:hypothetical protein